MVDKSNVVDLEHVLVAAIQSSDLLNGKENFPLASNKPNSITVQQKNA